MSARTVEQIEQQVALAIEGQDRGSKWPGMSYEQGVEQALRWVVGDESTPPMQDDEDEEEDN